MDRTAAIGTSAAAGAGSLTVGTIEKTRLTFTEIDIAMGMLPFDFTWGNLFAVGGFLLLVYSGIEARKSKKERKRRESDLL